MLRRSPRALALRGAAAMIAIATAALVATDLAALHRHAHDLGPERPALVARHDLTVGVTVHDGDLRERRLHASQLPSGVLGARPDAAGRVVTVPILRDGFVSDRNLAPRHRHGLDGAIPEGRRAMRVVVTDAVHPRPGAAIDVLASFDSKLGNDGVAPATVVAAAGVLVIDTDAARTSEGATALGVTIIVTPHEARDLAFAATHGALTIALVPPEEARGA